MRFDSLCASFGGVLSQPIQISLSNFSDRIFRSYMSHAGNISALLPAARGWNGEALWNTMLSGSGTDIDDDLAHLKAVCEAAERYSSTILLDHEYIVATANELGDSAFDWRNLPRFSEQELALPNQQFHTFNPDDPIRWIKAWNLTGERLQYVPVVMSHLYPRSWTSERFWIPISTGTAVHTDPATALVTAIAEIIERDSIALTWLSRRKLRKIEFSATDLASFPVALRDLMAANEEYILFDGTTDMGLPTVYLRRHRPAHPHAVNLVTCATDFNFVNACFKAIREVATLSTILDKGILRVPPTADDCFSIEDGAVYMSKPERAGAFDFLDGTDSIQYSMLQEREPLPVSSSAADQLRWLKQRALVMGKEILASELTCDELHQVGLRSFRAIMPSLMPMSTVTTARYLGADRLLEFHAYLQDIGEVANNSPLSINPFPQPFA